ncbi:MAG: moeZ 2 [Bryobacterales bacterium]|nr:moeZ 2 [Bryobacterales bacterium]
MADLAMEISPSDVKAKLDAGEPLRLIDCREQGEYDICRIEGARLLPMNSIPKHLQELDDDGAPIVVYCHHGVRSLSVVDWLRRQGVENAQSMSGGIDYWSISVDRSVPRY